MREIANILINNNKLSTIISQHQKWLIDENDGERAVFEGANLDNVCLKNQNLRKTSFEGTSLKFTDFQNCDLRGCIFRNADLTRANFENAILWYADLREANLSEANLRGTDLWGANLNFANFHKTILWMATFSKTSLIETDFNNSRLGDTIFSFTNLDNALNVEKCVHDGPSSIDQGILFNSKKIPSIFFRGIGISENIMNRLSENHNDNKYDFHSCFISYSHSDDIFARKLHDDLQSKGVRCWFAPNDLKIGDPIRQRIDDSITLQDKLLLILSKNSVSSSWVGYEVEKAKSKEFKNKSIVLFPIRLDDTVFDITSNWSDFLAESRMIGNFCNWQDEKKYNVSLNKLINDLRKSKVDH